MNNYFLPLSFWTRFSKCFIFVFFGSIIFSIIVLFVVPLISELCKKIKNKGSKTAYTNTTQEWRKLEEKCYSIIEESAYVHVELLKPYIVDKINYNIKCAPNDIFELDIEKTALIMLYNITVNNFITTGRYHIATGTLDIQGMQLFKFAKHVLNESLKKGYIVITEYNDCLNALYDNVAHLG